MTVFNVEMLPANEGDALWVSYARQGEPVRHVLIDCGRSTAYRAVAERMGENPDLNLELFVLTHVDSDHIYGAVRLLQDERFGPERVKNVWYNGWPQLQGYTGGVDVLGAQEGEYFGAVLIKREYAWNEKMENKTVVVNENTPAHVHALRRSQPTLLSPTPDKLADMRQRWIDDLGNRRDDRRIEPGDWETALKILSEDNRYGPDTLGREERLWPPDIEALATSDFDADQSEPNGSSIAFLAELDDKAVLFAADAHSPVLENGIRRLLEERGEDILRLDAYKMSHHGSARNNSLELAELIDCPLYLVSTNGALHHHPDPEALARMIWAQNGEATFAFNYRSEENAVWEDLGLQEEFGYKTVYPARGDGVLVEV